MQTNSKYREAFFYIIFGVLTTVVNTLAYYICAHWFKLGTLISNIIAWALAVAFAFITNKKFVFKSISWERKVVLREAAAFFLCRIATGVLDSLIMVVGVDVLSINDFLVKCISNILVIVTNYIFSKWIIFNSNNDKNS